MCGRILSSTSAQKGRGHIRVGPEQHHMLRPHNRAMPPDPPPRNSTTGNARLARSHLAPPRTHAPGQAADKKERNKTGKLVTGKTRYSGNPVSPQAPGPSQPSSSIAPEAFACQRGKRRHPRACGHSKALGVISERQGRGQVPGGVPCPLRYKQKFEVKQEHQKTEEARNLMSSIITRMAQQNHHESLSQ